MKRSERSAVRGSIGFTIGVSVATSLAFLGFPLAGLILGGALAGTLFAWKVTDVLVIPLAAIGADLGLLFGGAVVAMSFGVLAYGKEEVSGLPALGVLLGFYSVFILGFGVAGACLSAATASRLVSLCSGVSAFLKGGVVGGAVIVTAELLDVSSSLVVFAAITISVIVAGALCGASLKTSEEVSLSILERGSAASTVGKPMF